VVLHSVYVDSTLNAEVGIDHRLDTFKEDYNGRFRARLPDDMPRLERRRSGSTSDIHKQLSYNIFSTVDRFKNCYVAVLRHQLSGNPSPKDVFGAAVAKYHDMSPYKGFKPEVVAKQDDQQLCLWNVRKTLDRCSGATTMEALRAPRRLAPDSIEEEDEEEDLFNVPTSSTYERARKQCPQSGVQMRPIGTKAAKALSRIEAALQREAVAHTTGLNSIAQSAADRSTVAFWSLPMAVNPEEGRAWWAREASCRLRDEPDDHPVDNMNAPGEAEAAQLQQAIDATAAAAAVSGHERGGRHGGGVGRGAGRGGRGGRGRGGARGRCAHASVRRGAAGQRERRVSPDVSDDEDEAGFVTETDSDAGSPAPELEQNNVPIDDFEEYTVAPPPPPPTTMPALSASIEHAASAATALVLATATLRSSSDSYADNGGDAVDGDKGDSFSGAARGSRARRGRAGVSGSWPPLPPTLHAASSTRGRSTHAAKKQLFLDRARANGMSIDECIVNGMDWGSSSDGDKDNNDNGWE